MAIRREVFERARIAEHWDNSADDDMSLTKAIKNLVSKCISSPNALSHPKGVPPLQKYSNGQIVK